MGGLKQKLGNREVRIWYKVHDEQVSELIDQSLSLEQRARQACEMRNHNLTAARELMKDQKTRKSVNRMHQSLSLEQRARQACEMRNHNLTAARELMKDQKTRKSVNRMPGLE